MGSLKRIISRTLLSLSRKETRQNVIAEPPPLRVVLTQGAGARDTMSGYAWLSHSRCDSCAKPFFRGWIDTLGYWYIKVRRTSLCFLYKGYIQVPKGVRYACSSLFGLLMQSFVELKEMRLPSPTRRVWTDSRHNDNHYSCNFDI